MCWNFGLYLECRYLKILICQNYMPNRNFSNKLFKTEFMNVLYEKIVCAVTILNLKNTSFKYKTYNNFTQNIFHHQRPVLMMFVLSKKLFIFWLDSLIDPSGCGRELNLATTMSGIEIPISTSFCRALS